MTTQAHAARRMFPFTWVALAVIALLAHAVAAHAQAAVTPSHDTQAGAERPLSLAEAIAIATGSAPASGAASGGTPAVQIATLRTEEARARIGQARADVLPAISGTASEVNRTFNSQTLGLTFPSGPGGPLIPKKVGPFDVVDARVTARQTLFDPAGFARVGVSRQALAASRAERGTSAETAAQTASLAYLRAARAEATVAARRSDLDLAEALVRIADAQVRSGISPAIDSTRARTARASAEGDLLVASNQRDRARIELARAVGLDPTTRVVLTDSLDASLARSTAPEELQGAEAMALQHRPELQAERARQSEARSSLRAIRAERLPRLDLSGDYGLSGSHFSDAIGTHDVSVAVTWPLLDGLSRESRIAEQSAMLHEAEVRERDVKDQIVADVDGALLDIESGVEQQRVAGERLRLARQEIVQARERFEKGVAGNIEVINAQSSLVRARDAEIDARYATAVARVALARATGVAATVR